MSEQDQYDYIIVGAGILGCATAKYLQEEVGRSKRILLIDKYPACGQGNTSKSNACYRNIFDTELNIQLCNASIGYYKEVSKEFDLGLKEFGYLWLLTKQQMKARQERNLFIPGKNQPSSLLDFLDAHNVSYTIFNQHQLQEIFPGLHLQSSVNKEQLEIEYGLLGNQCGSLEPDLLVKYYEKVYKELGGDYSYGIEVIDILLKEKESEFDPDYSPTVWQESKVAGIRVRDIKTQEIKEILSKNIILCTGAWINQLLYKLGIHIGVNAKKRQLFRIKDKNKFVINTSFTNNFSSIPFIILPTGGVFIKPIPENGSVDVGCSDDIKRIFEREPELHDRNYKPFNNNLDSPKGEIDFYQTDVLPVLQAYFPDEFNEKVMVEHPSAGMYAYSLDKFPVVTKELGNLFICTGASGSGIMKGDAIARINVANILGKKECSLFSGESIDVKDFSIHERKLPQETLIL